MVVTSTQTSKNTDGWPAEEPRSGSQPSIQLRETCFRPTRRCIQGAATIGVHFLLYVRAQGPLHRARQRLLPADSRRAAATSLATSIYNGEVSNALPDISRRSIGTGVVVVHHPVVPASGQNVFASEQTPAVAPCRRRRPRHRRGTPAGPVRRISVTEAVGLALEQNLGIQVERLNPQIQDLRRSRRPHRSGRRNSDVDLREQISQEQPLERLLVGRQRQSSINRISFGTSVGVNQLLPWGGELQRELGQRAVTTRRACSTTFNPSLQSNFNAQITQPLLRNFEHRRTAPAAAHQQEEPRNLGHAAASRPWSRRCAASRTRTGISSTAIGVLEAAAAVARARAASRCSNNRTRVEVGTMAPIDIVQAESEVARNEESGDRRRGGDQARAGSAARADPRPGARRTSGTRRSSRATRRRCRRRRSTSTGGDPNALDKRTDLRQAKKTLEASDINIRYFENQTAARCERAARTTAHGHRRHAARAVRTDGAGGSPRDRSSDERGWARRSATCSRNDFPHMDGRRAGRLSDRREQRRSQPRARAAPVPAVADAAEEHGAAGHDAGARIGPAGATRTASASMRRDSPRELAERRLEAEQKKFSVGMSTSFFVFQAQRDLSQARNAEMRAILDYNQSLVDFEAMQEASLAAERSGIAARRIGRDLAAAAGPVDAAHRVSEPGHPVRAGR